MMKKVISFLLSITLCSSMLTIFPAASWDLNEEQAVEGDISSYYGIKNFVALNIPYEELSVTPYAENKEVKLGKELLNDALITEIKKVNPNFEMEYYSVDYNPSTGLLSLSKVIPTEYGNVFVGIGYTIYIENGMALELTYTDYPTQQKLNQEEIISSGVVF